MRGRRAPDTGLLTDRQQAQALIAAIDRGGLPLNPARINHIARSLGLVRGAYSKYGNSIRAFHQPIDIRTPRMARGLLAGGWR